MYKPSWDSKKEEEIRGQWKHFKAHILLTNIGDAYREAGNKLLVIKYFESFLSAVKVTIPFEEKEKIEAII